MPFLCFMMDSLLDLSLWGSYLLPAKAIFVAYDADPSGKKGSLNLAKLSAQIRCIRIPVLNPGDKDITDYVMAGGDLWEWFKYHLGLLELL